MAQPVTTAPSRPRPVRTHDRRIRPTRSRGARTWRWWLALSSLAISIVAPVPYLFSSLDDLARDSNELAANYAARPGWLQAVFYLHIGFGGIALLLAPLQLSTRIRRRRPVAHRVTGRIAGVAMLVAGAAALILSPYNTAGAIGTAGFGLLAIAWLATTVLTVATARRKDLAAHRRWAIRAFAVTYSAVTLRLWLGVMLGIQIGVMGVDGDLAFDRAYHIVPFLCWVPNLVAAEWWLSRRQAPDLAVTPRT